MPTSPPSAINLDIYLANLERLYNRDAALAAAVDRLPTAAMPPLTPARSGDATLSLRADDGHDVNVHSRYDPRSEARKFVDALPDPDNATFVVFGAGLGYHIEELERRFDRPVIVLVESDLGVLKAALCVANFSPLLDSGRLFFLTSDQRGEIHDKLGACNADLLLGTQFVRLPHTKRVAAAFHESARAGIADFLSFAKLQMVTLVQIGRTTFENVALNLPHLLARPGVEVLAGAARGRPAVVVAAGPSLARDLPLLRQAADRCVVIAVQTVLRTLLENGIRPHFVTSLDYHELSSEFFRDVHGAEQTVLVAEPKAAPTVLDAHPGPRHVLNHRYVATLLGANAPPRGSLTPGTTVAHLAFYLAQHLGCDPIGLLGQDLGFPDGLYYMPGAAIERLWSVELNTFSTSEMKQWDRIARNRSILRTIGDSRGGTIFSDDVLHAYAEQFRNDFDAAPQRVIQCSAGATLGRAECMSFAAFVETFCASGTVRLETPSAPTACAPLRTYVAALRHRSAEVREIAAIATEMKGLLAQLVDLVSRPAEFNRLIARVDELRQRVARHDEWFRVVIELSPAADLRRYQADKRLGSDQPETPELARRRLVRDVEFVDAFLEGVAFVQRVLPAAADRLERAAAVQEASA
jgi:hypothetical protein